MPAVPADKFRWVDIDQRLLSPKISDLAEEMHKRIAEGERKVAFDARQSGNAAGYLTRLFDFHEQLTDEWAKRLYTAHCEAWVQQNRTVSAAFIRAVRDRAIIQLIAVRKSSVQAEACRRGTATSQQPNPIALGAWNRTMNRLAARWNRKLEAEAVATEYRAVQVASGTAAPKGSPLFDVFISHATEDKNYVEPLVKALEAAGIRVWFDRNTLEWGDDLRSSIDRGLANCRYGIVVFSKVFLQKKKWTEYELNSLFALEQQDRKIILPIWHGITRDDFLQYGAGFADRLAKISSKDSYEDIVESLLALLGRSKPQEADVTNSTVSVVAEPAQAKPNAIAYAWYETTGENGAKAKAFIRPSTKQDGWFTFENSFGEEAHGTKEEIAMRFAAFDKSLKLKHYILMQHTSSDPAFRLG